MGIVKHTLLFICCSMLSLPLMAQRKNTGVQDPKEAKVVYLNAWVEKHKSLPRNLLAYEQVSLLNLAPSVRHVMYKDPRICVPIPNESRLRKFPKWISRLKELEEVNLRFNPAFPYTKELPKLYGLPKLSRLGIHPEEITDELIRVLESFPQLKELYIYQKINDQQLQRLQDKLPNTVVVKR